MIQEFSWKKNSEELSCTKECVLRKRFIYVNLDKDLFLVRVVMKMMRLDYGFMDPWKDEN